MLTSLVRALCCLTRPRSSVSTRPRKVDRFSMSAPASISFEIAKHATVLFRC